VNQQSDLFRSVSCYDVIAFTDSEDFLDFLYAIFVLVSFLRVIFYFGLQLQTKLESAH